MFLVNNALIGAKLKRWSGSSAQGTNMAWQMNKMAGLVLLPDIKIDLEFMHV